MKNILYTISALVALVFTALYYVVCVVLGLAVPAFICWAIYRLVMAYT